jgi:endonuclease YncB( thermonuclease family)
LLLAGAARLYILPPDVRFADLLARCEIHAQGQRIGIWQTIERG